MLNGEQSRLANAMGQQTPLYRKLAALLLQWTNCILNDNELWRHRCAFSIREIMMNAPSGGGIDYPIQLADFDYSGDYAPAEYKGGPLRFIVDFHHMDESGGYDGWTRHIVTVRAHLSLDFIVTISGRDKNGIKDYLADVFNYWLSQSVFRWDDYTEVE